MNKRKNSRDGYATFFGKFLLVTGVNPKVGNRLGAVARQITSFAQTCSGSCRLRIKRTLPSVWRRVSAHSGKLL